MNASSLFAAARSHFWVHCVHKVSQPELVALVVRDYDAATRFFVDVLHPDLIEDVASLTNDGRPKRWVVVRPRGAVAGKHPSRMRRNERYVQAARF